MKYIIFRADEYQLGADERMLQHTQAMTNILAEHYSGSGCDIPETGYRPTEYVQVESIHNPNKHGQSTHYRDGDWVVDRVQEYIPDLPIGAEFGSIVICYCKYAPIDSQLKPMPDRQIDRSSLPESRMHDRQPPLPK